MSTDYYIYFKPVPLILLTARTTLPEDVTERYSNHAAHPKTVSAITTKTEVQVCRLLHAEMLQPLQTWLPRLTAAAARTRS